MIQKYPSFINYLLLSIFGVLSVCGMLHHSLWLDEVNCWLMAKSSHSLPELFYLNRNSGNPFLWDLMLYVLTRFTDNPVYMQLLNTMISICTAFLFLKYSPFELFQKTCILFSYFPLFEYNIISRSYGLTWLLLVVFCALFMHKNRNCFSLVLVLVLLANTHLFSLIVSIPLFIITVYFLHVENPGKTRVLKLLTIIFIIGILASVISSIPAKDTTILQSLNEPYFSSDRISKAASYFVKGLYPLPNFFSFHFWNTNFLVSYIKPLSIALTAIILITPALLFRKKCFIMLFFYVSNAAILTSIFLLKLFTGTRYMGYCFTILLVALWLASDERFSWNPILSPIWSAANKKITRVVSGLFIWSILGIQLISGICCLYLGFNSQFSESKNVAGYIKSNLPPTSPVIVIPAFSGPAISTYLNRKLYYPETDSYGTFYQWNIHPVITNRELTQRIMKNLGSNNTNNSAIVLSLGMDSIVPVQTLIEATLDAKKYSSVKKVFFNDGMVPGENYVVYFLKLK